MYDEFGPMYDYMKAGKLRTVLSENARLSTKNKKCPVLIFSHGFEETGIDYYNILSELASHGYIIFSIEHTYDAYCVRFPNKNIILFPAEKYEAAQKEPDGVLKYQLAQNPVRAADILFCIEKIKSPGNFKNTAVSFKSLDLDKIGVFGHSLGGIAAARAAQLNHNDIKACMNMDADYLGFPYINYTKNDFIQCPFLFFASNHSLYITPKSTPPSDEELKKSGDTRRSYDSTMNASQRNQDSSLYAMKGHSYRISIERPAFRHGSFMDKFLFLKVSNNTFKNLVQNIILIRQYTLAFFDKELKNESVPLLQKSSSNSDQTIRIDVFK